MNTINKLLLVGEQSYEDLQGPFEHAVDGWTWNVILPLDDAEYSALSDGEEYVLRNLAEGWKAVALADGEVTSFGTVTDVTEFDGEDGLHVAVETPGRPD